MASKKASETGLSLIDWLLKTVFCKAAASSYCSEKYADIRCISITFTPSLKFRLWGATLFPLMYQQKEQRSWVSSSYKVKVWCSSFCFLLGNKWEWGLCAEPWPLSQKPMTQRVRPLMQARVCKCAYAPKQIWHQQKIIILSIKYYFSKIVQFFVKVITSKILCIGEQRYLDIMLPINSSAKS